MSDKKDPLYRCRHFIIKDDNKLVVVKRKFFSELSEKQIPALGMQIYIELQAQLIDTTRYGTVKIGSLNVVDGLERSLLLLERMYPQLMNEIHSVEKRVAGQRMAIS